MQRKAQKRDQLYETLKAAISGGQYASGSRLPKEVEFAAELGVSRKTLRHALERLENDHLIERIRSKGTFVRFRRYLVLADNNQDLCMPYNYIIPGIIRTAERMGTAVSICAFSAFENLTEQQVIDSITRQNAGCIVITNKIDENTRIYQQLKHLPLPVVLAHGHLEDHSFTGWPTVAYDEQAAWRVSPSESAGAPKSRGGLSSRGSAGDPRLAAGCLSRHDSGNRPRSGPGPALLHECERGRR